MANKVVLPQTVGKETYLSKDLLLFFDLPLTKKTYGPHGGGPAYNRLWLYDLKSELIWT